MDHSQMIAFETCRERAMFAVLILIGCAGLAARFWLMKLSIGCDDADIWLEHAKLISKHGLRFVYQHPELETFQFNHPPLMGYFSVLGLNATDGDLQGFSCWMKAPGLVAELVGAVLVWRVWSKRNVMTGAWAFAAFGTSTSQILISGFHCNTDPLYAVLTLLAFYLLLERGSPILSGLAMAAAVNVKILPLLVVLPLLSQCRSWRDAYRLSLAASVAIVPYLPFLLTDPASIYRNMVAYNSQQLEWGIYTFLEYGGHHPLLAHHLRQGTDLFVREGRYLIVVAIMAFSVLAWQRSRRFGFRAGAVAWALFLCLTPGYGVQYAVSVLPLLFAADFYSAALYSALVGLMALFIYTHNMTWKLPLHANVQYYPFPPVAVLFGVLAWAVLVSYALKSVKSMSASVGS